MFDLNDTTKSPELRIAEHVREKQCAWAARLGHTIRVDVDLYSYYDPAHFKLFRVHHVGHPRVLKTLHRIHVYRHALELSMWQERGHCVQWAHRETNRSWYLDHSRTENYDV